MELWNLKGIPPVIYLAMNKTLRKDSKKIVWKWLFGEDLDAKLRAKVLFSLVLFY